MMGEIATPQVCGGRSSLVDAPPRKNGKDRRIAAEVGG